MKEICMSSYSIKLYASIMTTLLMLDRLTKYIVMYSMPHYQVNSFLSIDLVFNRGISFGMFHSRDAIIFTAVNVLISMVIVSLAIHTYYRLLHKKIIIGELCIFTGAISNVIDRYVYSGVVDFISLSYKNWHFAVFNIADCFIFLGVVIMLILESKDSWKKL